MPWTQHNKVETYCNLLLFRLRWSQRQLAYENSSAGQKAVSSSKALKLAGLINPLHFQVLSFDVIYYLLIQTCWLWPSWLDSVMKAWFWYLNASLRSNQFDASMNAVITIKCQLFLIFFVCLPPSPENWWIGSLWCSMRGLIT